MGSARGDHPLSQRLGRLLRQVPDLEFQIWKLGSGCRHQINSRPRPRGTAAAVVIHFPYGSLNTKSQIPNSESPNSKSDAHLVPLPSQVAASVLTTFRPLGRGADLNEDGDIRLDALF
jgi:hypothetical protein